MGDDTKPVYTKFFILLILLLILGIIFYLMWDKNNKSKSPKWVPTGPTNIYKPTYEDNFQHENPGLLRSIVSKGFKFNKKSIRNRT